ncbi:MAG: hydrolase [Pseudomonadota bacterium]
MNPAAVAAPVNAPPPFSPPSWLRNAHLQTLLANKPLRWPKGPRVHDEAYELPDGDIVRLVRNISAASADSRPPRVVVLHGLAGGYDSAYARDLFTAFEAHELEGHLLHFRGCGDLMNRLPRGYHAGDTSDFAHYVSELHREAPERPIYAVGFSLGANVLLKYLGTENEQGHVAAAVAVSVPFLLDDACESISSGFSLLYHKVLLRRLKQSMVEKFGSLPADQIPFDYGALKRVGDLRSFDDLVTAPMHGFGTAEHYYAVSSCRQYLLGIDTPTLILHAADDPFQSPAGIPTPSELASPVELELSAHGGHVGFLQGTSGGLTWKSWLTPRITAYLRAQARGQGSAT